MTVLAPIAFAIGFVAVVWFAAYLGELSAARRRVRARRGVTRDLFYAHATFQEVPLRVLDAVYDEVQRLSVARNFPVLATDSLADVYAVDTSGELDDLDFLIGNILRRLDRDPRAINYEGLSVPETAADLVHVIEALLERIPVDSEPRHA